MPQPKIETRKISDFSPDPSNANKGTERGLRILDNSLSEVGLGRSAVADKNGLLIAGNKTQERAIDSAFEEAIVVHTTGKQLVIVQRDDLDLLDDDPNNPARRMAYYDNVASQHMAWDAAQIAADVEAGVNLDAMFTPGELEDIYAGLDTGEPVADPGAQIDKAAELQEKWQVKRGDLWIIGKHRLLCGDSTNADDVARVMGGKKAVLMATDPPYGVDFEGAKYNPRAKDWEGIENDKLQGGDLETFLTNFLNAWLPYIDERAGFYFWTAAMQEGAAAAAIRGCGLHIQSQIIWMKNTLVLGQADYQWKHENCWYAFWKGKKHFWYGGRAQTTVWEIDKVANQSYMHPMQKPVDIYSIPMQNHTLTGEICAEPFAGSGSQFAAAEQIKRVVYGIEFAENYCAVILERMAGMGLTPQLEAQI